MLVGLLFITGAQAQNVTTMNKQNEAKGQIITSGKLIYSEITIQATPDKVWAVLTDFNSYPLWNPFIKSFIGTPVVGQQIEAKICPPGAKGMTFRPTILQYNKHKELRWIGKLFISHLFDGEHTFMLTDNGDGTTTLMQYERFRGILLPFFGNMLDVNTIDGFKQMNAALKARVESMN